MNKDYYSILGVSPEANDDEIRAAFERLSSTFDNDYKGEERLAEVEEAYVVLSDPQSRAEYNRLYKIFGGFTRAFDGLDPSRAETLLPRGIRLENSLPISKTEETIDLELDLDELDSPALNDLVNALKSTIFNLINGQKEQSLKDGPSRSLDNANVYLDMQLRPKEKGYKFLDYYCYVQCSDCQGKGSWRGLPLINCLTCAGLKNKESCLVCVGLGKYPEENCPKCKGEGRVIARRQMEVKIPKNIQHNSIIQVAGGGHHGFRGLKNGDLFIKLLLTSEENR